MAWIFVLLSCAVSNSGFVSNVGCSVILNYLHQVPARTGLPSRSPVLVGEYLAAKLIYASCCGSLKVMMLLYSSVYFPEDLVFFS